MGSYRGPPALHALVFTLPFGRLPRRLEIRLHASRRSFSRRYGHAIIAASPLDSTKPKNRTVKLRRLENRGREMREERAGSVRFKLKRAGI